MAETITLTLNVGPNAPISALGAAVADVTRVLEFAGALQRRADRGALAAARVRTRRFRYGEFGFNHFFYVREPEYLDGPIDEFERIARREAEANSEIRVQSLRYENPLELVFLVAGGGAVIFALLRLIRDWPERRRVNAAAAREYENGVIFRRQVRERVLERIDSGEIPLTPETVDALLTDDVANALGALADGPIQIRGLPSSSDDSEPAT